MKPSKMWIALLAQVGLVVAGCSGGSGENTSGGGPVDPSASLDIAWLTPPQGVDPALECHIGCRPYWLPVFETLYDVENSINIVPFAAAALPTYSADGLQLTIPLREGRTFHDGTPIDAAAVKTDIERAKTLPKSTAASSLKIVKSVDVANQWTVKITLSQPRPDFEAVLSGPEGALISPKAIASGRNINLEPGDAGSGPYQLKSLVPNNKAVYTAVPNYWKPNRGRVATLNINGITDVNTGINGLQSGQFDLAYGEFLPEARVKQLEAAGFHVPFHESLNTEAILLRINRGALSNPLVRQAMMMAIDRDAISKQIYDGKCVAANQMYTPNVPLSTPGYNPYPYDPAKAKQLLTQAGFPNGFGFDIVTVSGQEASEQNAQVVQQMLGQVGIKVTVTPMTSVEGNQQFTQDKLDARATVGLFEEDSLGTVDYVFMPDGQNHLAIGQADTLTRLHNELTSTTDPAKEQQILAQMGKELTDQVYALPLCYQTETWAASKKVTGMETLAMRGVFDPRALAVTK
ncbi:MAG TPA: ABC transporter substrate-binding protein [Amycolatopsis sp.]|nr:ABC transporter substrate-binding protein [Amycolatopsis sp.]